MTRPCSKTEIVATVSVYLVAAYVFGTAGKEVMACGFFGAAVGTLNSWFAWSKSP